MKKILFLLLACAAMTVAYAQKTTAKFSEELSFGKNMFYLNALGFEKEKLYAFSEKQHTFAVPTVSISVINTKTMLVEQTTTLVSDEKSEVVGGLVAKGQRWVFLRKLDKKPIFAQ